MSKATLMRIILASAKAKPFNQPHGYEKTRERKSQQDVYCLRLAKTFKKDGWSTYYYLIAICKGI
jgi:hypothetical protein